LEFFKSDEAVSLRSANPDRLKITAEAEPERSEGEATIVQNPNFEKMAVFIG